MRAFIFLGLLAMANVSAAADMDVQSFERVNYAICKDSSNTKQCSNLVYNLMFQVKSNTEIKLICDQLDEKGGDSSSKPACATARNIDSYITNKKDASN
ncbi:hypothetical protein [Duffyella gerundensis]|uniref:hypothetical protein n=1 Tax=Duffyella gerundensis TaxID=1619313 RepID=UPI0021F794DC|nr:hypothetical protein [Duffyella gerundensis]